MNDFKTVIQEAIELIENMEESRFVKVRGRVVKINLLHISPKMPPPPKARRTTPRWAANAPFGPVVQWIE